MRIVFILFLSKDETFKVFCTHKNTLNIEAFPHSFKIVEQFSHSEEESVKIILEISFRGGDTVECSCRVGYDLAPDGYSCVGEFAYS